MLVKTYGCAIQGVEAIMITVEVNLCKGHQQVIVGLPDNAVKESLPRVESAIKNSFFRMPDSKIVFNLAPADIKKTGSAFDLAMAVALLGASEQIPDPQRLQSYVLMGELSLDGSIQAVKGALPVAMQAWKEGFKGLIVPEANSQEAAMVTKIPVYAVTHLSQVIDFFTGLCQLDPVVINTREQFYATQYEFDMDYADVKGQDPIKRALEIAAAGGHNAILIGPPGSGKSMLAKRLPTILPPLTLQESLETTRIYSICGRMAEHKHRLVNKRPFRSPHHTISNVALVGGGSFPVPGEISLAHNGVLFLDELPEFSRNALEVMRQPLEDGKVTIARAMRSIEFPANFMLLASMNPCPCGYFNHPEKPCNCSGFAIQKYLGKVSGPLLDRIDLHIDVKPVPAQQLADQVSGRDSQSLRTQVMLARQIQTDRFAESQHIHCNAQMTSAQIRQYCVLNSDGTALLSNAMQRLKLSGRAYDRILKVSRTIADLADRNEIGIEHLSEAIGYRSLDRESLMEAAGNKKKPANNAKGRVRLVA